MRDRVANECVIVGQKLPNNLKKWRYKGYFYGYEVGGQRAETVIMAPHLI